MRRRVLDQLMQARREGRVMVRALDLAGGEEVLLDPSSDTSPLAEAASAAVRADECSLVTVDGRTWFLSVYHTPWELVLVGAVHIAQALASLAGPCGYRVRVIDPRSAYASADRFPGIILQPAWPDEALAERPLTARSALIALAHDANLDDQGLAAALRSPAFYIGALGSVRTHARRLIRLRARGFTSGELARIHGPVGLAIGARSPAEIAIAILAELIQRRRAALATRRIAGVVLAAGMSTRMGKNKLTLPFRGKPLIRHSVEAALAAALHPVIVVIGHEADTVRGILADLPVTFAQNSAFAEGLSTSLRAGIEAVPASCDGAMVLLGDMPEISAALIARIAAAFDPAKSRTICAATFRGERGHPVLWGRALFAEIRKLRGDIGARSVMERHSDILCDIEADSSAPLIDIDTPGALAAHTIGSR